MNNRTIIFIIIAVALGSSILTLVWYRTSVIYDLVELPMDATVVEKNRMGFNVENDSIHFGKLPLGSIGTRSITIGNSEDERMVINIKTYGNISQWVRVTNNGFVLEPGESYDLRVLCEIPEDAKLGYYSGTLEIIYAKALS